MLTTRILFVTDGNAARWNQLQLDNTTLEGLSAPSILIYLSFTETYFSDQVFENERCPGHTYRNDSRKLKQIYYGTLLQREQTIGSVWSNSSIYLLHTWLVEVYGAGRWKLDERKIKSAHFTVNSLYQSGNGELVLQSDPLQLTHHLPIGPCHTGHYPVHYRVHYWPVINQWGAELILTQSNVLNRMKGFTINPVPLSGYKKETISLTISLLLRCGVLVRLDLVRAARKPRAPAYNDQPIECRVASKVGNDVEKVAMCLNVELKDWHYHSICIQVHLQQGFRKCSFYREQPVRDFSHKVAKCGEASQAAPEWMDGKKREIPEKTRRKAASSGSIPTCEDPEAGAKRTGEEVVTDSPPDVKLSGHSTPSSVAHVRLEEKDMLLVTSKNFAADELTIGDYCNDEYRTHLHHLLSTKLRELRKKSVAKRSPKYSSTGPDEHYRPHAAEALPDTPGDKIAVLEEEYLRSLQEDHCAEALPDTPGDKLAVLEEEYLRSLQEECTDERRRAIQSNIKDQTTSQELREQRRERITGSCFGKICKMLTTTSCASVVEYIRYPRFSGNAHTRWGIEMEATALLSVSEILGGGGMEKCSFFIPKEYPYFGATSNGVIEESVILEIKFPSSSKDMSPEEAFTTQKITFLRKENNTLRLKKEHPYFYQVQGQLNITELEVCLLLDKVKRRKDMWQEIMLPKLTVFYMECLLLEIVDSRRARGRIIREAHHILEAQAKAISEKTKEDVKMN
ncbi:hypothetical protein PR048_024121 [Dryococelus australis]|uniref:YqaJ viral recombinase domain-containing protein n=1 Tax=Dryococelus australis TaxID=614101 RepID=A0ABQ9GW01_9NEOP|nr:hypothetical protein PR048_024121 [Dryococelus australis]